VLTYLPRSVLIIFLKPVILASVNTPFIFLARVFKNAICF